ncbi:hypothetical protein [Thermodesulfitimonas autotrophica]|nr:hypothetical protein [Thermodesulfitimonas autotrophica]
MHLGQPPRRVVAVGGEKLPVLVRRDQVARRVVVVGEGGIGQGPAN